MLFRSFIGFIDATTSESSVFFDTGFHDANIARLFESILTDRQPFDEQLVKQTIKHIETEMKSVAHVQKMIALTSQLSACQTAFCGVDSQAKTSSPAKSPLKFRSDPESFTDVAITIEILDASNEMTAAFFCLANVLADLVYEANFDLLPMYPTSPSQFIAYQDGSAITQTYSVHLSENWQNIADIAKNYLRSFDVSKHTGSLADIAELFRTHPSYTAAPLDFYQKTEIPADCESLASSITPDRLQRILHQAKIRKRSDIFPHKLTTIAVASSSASVSNGQRIGCVIKDLAMAAAPNFLCRNKPRFSKYGSIISCQISQSVCSSEYLSGSSNPSLTISS